ncbi:hypothetical protein Tco_1396861, partial [Tanacetum coccineum]
VMAISVISVSSDSSEDSVGTPAGRVILFGTIPTTIPDTTPVITHHSQTDTTVIPTETPIIAPTIPPSPDYTPASPDYSPASDSENSDTLDTPPSPTHGTPFTKITSSTQRSPVIPRRRVMILAPGQPIPHGRPYRYHLNGPVYMMTARKRVGSLPVQQLAVRHYVDHSSLDYFSPDDSAQDFSSDSSSDASSDFHSDASSHSKASSKTLIADVEVDPRETSLRDDIIVRTSGVDVRVESMTVDRDDVETGTRDPIVVSDDRDTPPMVPEVIPKPAQEGATWGTYKTLWSLVQRFHDHTQAILVHRIQVIEDVQREQGHRIVRVESTVTALTERVAELERDNRRLRGTASVKSQRVNRLQRSMSRMQRELRQIRQKMPNTRSGASMTHEEVEKLVTRQVAEEMEAREAVRTLEPLNENGDDKEGENGGNRNGGNGGNGNGENGNGDRNRNHGMNYGGFMPVARECTFQDFLK